MSNKNYGWVPDVPDHRDFILPTARRVVLPPSVDLTTKPKFPAVYDQGDAGSCTGNGIGFGVQFDKPDFQPSRLFIYWNERVKEKTTASDSGASIRDGIKSVAKQGVCSEIDWPYDLSKLFVKPDQICYTNALANKVIKYQRVRRNLQSMKVCLAKGFPFVFGFTVYDSFESEEVAKTGVLNMPLKSENVLGGHCVAAVGYDTSKERFLIRNSWGPDWGMKGYFTMPEQYLLDDNLSDDFWVIETIKS